MFLRTETVFVAALLCLLLQSPKLGAQTTQITLPAGAKICPDEPILAPNTTCPSICSGGCVGSTCIIQGGMVTRAPNIVVCPEGLSCRIECSPFTSCAGKVFLCPRNASCDFFCTQDSCRRSAVICNETSHSCAVYCDSASQLGTVDCNSSRACNCRTECSVRYQCIPGLNCPGGPCGPGASRDNLSPACDPFYESNSPLMLPSPTPANPCSCFCNSSAQIQFAIQNPFSGVNVSYCPPTSISFCSGDADCANGARCNMFTRFCTCPDGKDIFDGCRSNVSECSNCPDRAACLQGQTPSSSDACLCKRGRSGRFCDAQENLSTSCPALLLPNTTQPSRICPTDMCDYCEDDGTCVNHIPGPHLVCPDDRPCRFIATYATGPSQVYLFCNGSYSCDLVCNGLCSGVHFVCASPSCRTVCPLAPLGDENDIVEVYCTNNQTGCHCDNLGCKIRQPCFPGADCFGDPCAGEAGRLVSRYPSKYYVDTNGQCQSREGRFCVPFYSVPIRNPFGFSGCDPLIGTQDCSPKCINGGYCNQGRCSCLAPWSGADCSVNQTAVGIPTPSCPPVPIATPEMISNCPSVCDECVDNKCLIYTLYTDIFCPLGYHCVAICSGLKCYNGRLICNNNTGPCDIICSGRLDYADPRSPGACALAGLVCDTSHRCQAHCLYDTTIGNYNPIRHLICNGASNTSSSCGCGSETCHVPPANDPCFDPNDIDNNLVKRCPYDLFGTRLVPRAVGASCVCSCPGGGNETLIQGFCQRADCSPRCENGGICFTSVQNTPKCQCFSGWTGASCTSRCFFPVAATVISCDEGRYVIDGKLEFNTTIDIFKNVTDLNALIVQGNVSISSGVQIGLAANRTASINVQGNYIQLTGSTIIVSALQSVNITITNQAILAGTLYVQLNSTQQLPANGSPLRVTIMSYAVHSGQFDTVTVQDASGVNFDNSTCRKLLVSIEYQAKSLILLIQINDDACAPTTNAGEASGLAAGTIAGIAIAAVVVVAAFAFIIATLLIPSLREKILPFKSKRDRLKVEIELQDVDYQIAPESPRWNRATAQTEATNNAD